MSETKENHYSVVQAARSQLPICLVDTLNGPILVIATLFPKHLKRHPWHLPFGASLVAQTVKNPPAMWEIWVQSLGWEDPLEKGMATHSSILA